MFKRLKTLAMLSKVLISQNPDGAVELDFKNVVKDIKPKGKAVIVEDNPLDQFPSHDEELK